MRRLCVMASMATLVASLPMAVASVASASSLLSGYGGPGQGNQAILGSALLNGPRGGSGSGGGGSTGGPGSSQTGLQAPPVQRAGALAGKGRAGSGGSTASAKAGARKGRTVSRASASAETDASRPSASGGAAVAYPVSERDGGGTFGLSDMDLVYILLVLGALALTGVFIRLLTRSQIPAERSATAAKEM